MYSDSNENKSIIREGNAWYADRYESVKVQRNRYFILLVVCFVALIISLLANLALSPLKTAVPYVVEVDKTSGMTTVLTAGDAHSVKQQPTVTNYFLSKYLNARMNYDWGLRQINADTVRALSSAQVYQGYAAQMDVSNAQSPIKLYANNKVTSVHIINHSMPYPNIAEYHFYTETLDKNNPTPGSGIKQYWLATIKFTYANNKLSMNDREKINPLGFFVTDFQLSQSNV